MELEDLKNIWQHRSQQLPQKGEAEIAAMLKGRSKSIISKLKRNVWIELVITLVAGIALLIYAITLPSGSLKWTSISILVIFVGYTIYYIKKLRLISQYSAIGENIKINLEQLTFKLASYVRFYKRSYTILYPVYFLLGILFSGIEHGTDNFLVILSKTRTLVFLFGFGVLFYLVSTWFVTWLFQKLYGNHIDRLKALLRELEP
jgi:uncharacterized membrane protein AbrB (regulator of aidB expression)